MRTPADLMQAAEELSRRIPLAEDYALEQTPCRDGKAL